MKNTNKYFLLLFTIFMFSCGDKLPKDPPKAINVEYTKADEGFPPRIKGATNIKEIGVTILESITKEQNDNALKLALQNKNLLKILGESYSFLESYYVDESKESHKKQYLNLVFFSYTNNYMVNVNIQNNEIVKSEINKEMTPMASEDEISTAIEIARSNSEVKSKTRGLIAQGILSYNKFENPELNRERIIYISFSKKENDDIDYYAYVNLITKKVVENGLNLRNKNK